MPLSWLSARAASQRGRVIDMSGITRRAIMPIAAATLLLTAPSASAATLEIDNASGIGSMASCQGYADGGSAGYACFHAYGDYFYLYSGNSGVRVAVQWKLGDGSRAGIIRWMPTDQYTKGVKNKDLPENKQVGMRFGVCWAGQGCDTAADIQFLSGWVWTSTT
jgi:hypothetical protein